MAQTFTIKLLESGTLTGTWRVPPDPPPATASEVADALNSFASEAQPQSSPASCAYFGGEIELTGGNPWDGVYDTVNDIPIAGVVPEEGLSVLRGRFTGPGVPPANTVSIGDNSPLFDRAVGAVAGVTLNLSYTFPTIRSLFLLATELMGAVITSAAPTISIRRLYIDGSYDIVTWDWGIANGTDFTVPTTPEQTGKLFAPEDTVTIQSGSPAGSTEGDIDNIYTTADPDATGPALATTCGDGSGSGITEIILSWNDPTTGEFDYIIISDSDFIDWTCINITFILPDSLPPDVPITVSPKSPGFPPIKPPKGTGTQFSGSVKLGILQILGATASGIYKIVPDKRSDTVYIDSPASDETIEMAIPYPHGKTFFVG